MSYIVFARKYRPQTFDDIVGQPHITTTLKNAISQDRIAHAYIFAGPRGVGKTTTARIFAKALNCEKGPTPKPCNSCPSCKEITQGSSLDILEIDGASNRGIEEIRNLRDNVKFAPSKGRLKVYIIDEVHMLTAEAFNALLKTLEEPPPHVKFIFATTQAHKVPLTILSRCQRFDFRRISTKDISENLKGIVRQEGLSIGDEALSLIAKYADGSMRDAQVVLDQITSFTKGKTEAEDVARILGIVDEEVLFGLSKAITEKDPRSALKIIESLVNDGKDIIHVVLGLIEHFRNLSVIKISSDLSSLIDAGADKIKRYRDEAQKFTIEEMLYIIYTLSNTIDFIRKSSLSRVPFETAIVKLTLSSPVVSLAEIMKRLQNLEIGSSAVPAQEAAGPKPKAEASRQNEAPKAPSDNQSKDIDEVLSSWTGVINYIKSKKISVASYLQEGYPISLEGNVITIGFPKEFQFHKEVLDSPENRRLIEEAINKALNLELNVALTTVEPVNIQRPAMNGYTDTGRAESRPDQDDSVKKEADPIIKAALEMFGGEIANNNSKKAGPR